MNGLIILTAMCLIALSALYDRIFGDRHQVVFAASVPSGSPRNNFWEIVIGTILLPLIIFVFTLFTTKSFNVRYVIAGAIGTSAILAETINGFPPFRRVLPAILLAASLFMLAWGMPSIEYFHHSAAYKFLSGPYPIVVADGSQFFQLEETSPDDIRSRLVYLILPADVPVGDITNEHVIMRWKKINPSLPVVDASTFLASNSKFYVLDERTADDTPAAYLMGKHLIAPWVSVNGGLIYRSRPSSQMDVW